MTVLDWIVVGMYVVAGLLFIGAFVLVIVNMSANASHTRHMAQRRADHDAHMARMCEEHERRMSYLRRSH